MESVSSSNAWESHTLSPFVGSVFFSVFNISQPHLHDFLAAFFHLNIRLRHLFVHFCSRHCIASIYIMYAGIKDNPRNHFPFSSYTTVSFTFIYIVHLYCILLLDWLIIYGVYSTKRVTLVDLLYIYS